MTEPLPEKVQAQVNELRDKIHRGEITTTQTAEKIGTIALNAYNVGKNPEHEMIQM